MANSSTDICNLTSDLLSAGTVTDIENPTTATESLFKRWYDQTRLKLLREHPWNFAVKRIILAADNTDPAFGYSAQFSLPSDFVRLLYIGTDLSTDRETLLPTELYQVEGNKVLLNEAFGDATSLRLVYVFDAKDVAKFDPMFINLLSVDLALSLAYKFTESNTNVQKLREMKRDYAMQAKAIDGQERPPIRVERSKALAARRRGTTKNTHRIYFD